MATAVAESCAAGSFDLILTQPPWENDEKQKYDGFSMEGVIHNASHIDLTAVAFFIYLFSAVFQGARCWFFETKFQPNGPEFSRWLKYAFTSPLQVLLVALTFGVSNIDILLGYFGMQLALVIMGYSIEQQIRKTYVREQKVKPVDKFYWMPWLVWPFGPDIRGPVYLLVSWTLHILIWGVPHASWTDRCVHISPRTLRFILFPGHAYTAHSRFHGCTLLRAARLSGFPRTR